jgi:hypothetical protein
MSTGLFVYPVVLGHGQRCSRTRAGSRGCGSSRLSRFAPESCSCATGPRKRRRPSQPSDAAVVLGQPEAQRSQPTTPVDDLPAGPLKGTQRSRCRADAGVLGGSWHALAADEVLASCRRSAHYRNARENRASREHALGARCSSAAGESSRPLKTPACQGSSGRLAPRRVAAAARIRPYRQPEAGREWPAECSIHRRGAAREA